MDELRKNHILQIRSKNTQTINAIVIDYTKDRILALVCEESIDEAKKINELDNLLIKAHTHCGIKNMKSAVISELDNNNCIVIENNPIIPFEQKRKFVRVLSSVNFTVEKNGVDYSCNCVNISAGGIAFYSKEGVFEVDDKVVVKLSRNDFLKDIVVSSQIIKVNQFDTVAKYLDLDKNSEDKIVKYVFDLIAKK